MAETATPAKPGGAGDSLADVKRRVNKVVLLAGLAMTAVIAVTVWATLYFVATERERDIQGWQSRLAIVADSRAAAANEWIAQNFSVLRGLVENQSLQLYVSELAEAKGDRTKVTDESAQAGFLRILMITTAERSGFKPPATPGEIKANVERVGVAGIGLVDAAGMPIATSDGMPVITGRLRVAVTKALTGAPAIVDIHLGGTNLPTMAFALPVFGVQATGTEAIGAVIGVRVVDRDLYDRLKQPGEFSTTGETYLIRAAGNQIEYLSPLADGSPPLTKTLAADTKDLVDAYAIEKPGGFAIKRDYAAVEVLAVSRAIADVPWILVRKISRDEALAESDRRAKTLLITFLLIIVSVTIAIIGVWRHGSSLRATQAAERHRIAAERFENLVKFSRLVTDSQPTHIVAVNPENKITYANRPFADFYGIPITDIRFKDLAGVVGPVKTKQLTEINKRVLEKQARERHVLRFDEPDGTHVLTSDHVYIPADANHPPAALMIINDVTELTRQKERNEAIMQQLINTLVSVVDRRDPYAANHSTRVAEVARAISEEMELNEYEARTTEIAASLMNLGKIFIPLELLTKTEDLSADERELVANSYKVSGDLLKDVPFEEPVVDTIRQMHENWDGTGPLKLMGERILRAARILAVANAFVGMASVRAYRGALSFDKITQILLEQAGTKFDRRPVTALINVLDNRGGAQRWAHFRAKPA